MTPLSFPPTGAGSLVAVFPLSSAYLQGEAHVLSQGISLGVGTCPLLAWDNHFGDLPRHQTLAITSALLLADPPSAFKGHLRSSFSLGGVTVRHLY